MTGSLLTGRVQVASWVGLLAPATAVPLNFSACGRTKVPLTRCPGAVALGSWTVSAASPAVLAAYHAVGFEAAAALGTEDEWIALRLSC